MSWYKDVDESSEEIKVGTHVAELTSVKAKDSKKGDKMIVLGLTTTTSHHHVSKYLVIRKDLARIWRGELAKIGVDTQALLDEARENSMTFEQFVWSLVDAAQKRLHCQVEIGVAFKDGSDLPDVKLRKLVGEPEDRVSEGEEDAIPF